MLTRHPELADTTTTRVITYRDTIIFVPILGTDTVFQAVTIRDTIKITAGTAHSVAYVVKDTIYSYVWSTDTVLAVRIDSLITEVVKRDIQISVLEKGEGKFFKVLDQFTKLFIILAIIAGIVVIVPRIFKKR